MPAAGRALRLAGSGSAAAGRASKEVLPVGRERRPAAALLLDAFRRAGVARAYVVLRPGKWDVAETLGDGSAFGVPLAYRVVAETSSVAETLDRAYPFVRGRRVALGFPDILFEPAEAFARVAEAQARTGAHAVLGLVPTDRPDKADLVETGPGGRVRRLILKPERSAPGLTWIAAVWSPAMIELLHREVSAGRRGRRGPGGRELYPGDLLQVAVDEGLRVEAVRFPEGRHLDIGTPEDLARAQWWPERPPEGG